MIDVVNDFYCNKKILNFIKKHYDEFDANDVLNDVCICVLEKGFFSFENKDALEKYCFTIIKNTVKNKYSKQNKHYKKQGQELTIEPKEEQPCNVLNYSLASLSWYEKEIMSMYINEVTVDVIVKMTKIPRSSIYNTIKNSIKKIKYAASIGS